MHPVHMNTAEAAREPLPRPALFAPPLSEADRLALSDWSAELAKLLAEWRGCLRTRNAPLQRHLNSAAEGARDVILAICGRNRAELMEKAVSALAPYFTHRGDAVEAVRSFEAIRAARQFLRGPFPAETLEGAGLQAEETLRLIERIQAGGELWSFDGTAPAE